MQTTPTLSTRMLAWRPTTIPLRLLPLGRKAESLMPSSVHFMIPLSYDWSQPKTLPREQKLVGVFVQCLCVCFGGYWWCSQVDSLSLCACVFFAARCDLFLSNFSYLRLCSLLTPYIFAHFSALPLSFLLFPFFPFSSFATSFPLQWRPDDQH